VKGIGSRAFDVQEKWLLTGAVLGWAFVGFYLFHWGAHWALDLRVYRAAGRSLYHGGKPYSSFFTASRLPFTYPPFALLTLSPLSVGPLGLIKALWWAINEAALIAILYLVIDRATAVTGRKALLLAFAGGAAATMAFEPLRSNLDYGQINLLLMAMVLVDILAIKGRGRGILVGVAAAIKLTPLLYVAYFLLERDRRAAYRGAATFVGLTGLSWLILPSESTLYWFHEAFTPSRTGPVGSVSNQSWNGVLHRAPFHSGSPTVAIWVTASVVTLLLGVIAARSLISQYRPVEALLVLALTELLVSPISWSHHWSWVVIAPVVLITRWRSGRWLVAALATLVIVAIAEPYWWSVHGWLGDLLNDSLTLCGAGALLVLARTAQRSPKREALMSGG
jgi:alpha-1,2-mannosyltransferase